MAKEHSPESSIHAKSDFFNPPQTKEDYIKLGQKALNDISRVVIQSTRENPVGLWREIQTLPKTVSEEFYNLVIPAFQLASEKITQAIKTADPLEIISSIVNSSCDILESFSKFFTALAEKHPQLAEIAKKSVQIALIVALSVAAPYLAPVELELILNPDVIGAIGAGLAYGIYQTCEKLRQVCRKSPILQEQIQSTEQTMGYLNLLQAKYHLPIEELGSLNFNPMQLEFLNQERTNAQSLLESLILARQNLPLSSPAYELMKRDFQELMEDICAISSENRSQLSPLIEKSLIAFDKAKESPQVEGNIFAQTTHNMKIFNSKITPALMTLHHESRDIPEISSHVQNRLELFQKTHFYEPLEELNRQIQTDPALCRELGLGYAQRLEIERESSRLAAHAMSR